MGNRRIKLAKVDENEDLKREILYPSEWEQDVFESFFAVTAPYHIVKGEDGKDFIIPAYTNTVKHRFDRTKISKVYNPFEEKYIFEKAIRIDTNSPKSILEFCNEYGLFRDGEVKGYQNNVKAPVVFDRPEQVIYFNKSFQLSTFVNIIDEIKETVRLVKIIQERNADQLTELKNRILNLLRSLRDDDGKIPERTTEIIKKIENEPKLTFAKRQLLTRLNYHQEYVYPCTRLGENGDLIPGHTSRSLLSVIYFQISEMVTKSQPLEKCLKCGSIFTPRKSGSVFCPPEDPTKRSSCENSYNQMVRRAREAILSEQKTIEQICKTTGRSFEEVRGWIENYKGKLKG